MDTAADRTVIPGQFVHELELLPIQEMPVAGIGGAIHIMPTFLVRLTVRQHQTVVVEVLASNEEPYVLLGRDILNDFRVLLDGPGQKLELG